MEHTEKKILIIAPHADDEILGCGGYILSEINKGAKVHVWFGTIGGRDFRQKYDIRDTELKNVSQKIGFTYEIFARGYDAAMDQLLDREVITALDDVIKKFEPNEVFVNYPSRHQDHKKVYDCTMAAMRLKEGFMPSLFALYEYPFITGVEMPQGGYMYVDITDSIETKADIFELYASQVKESPSPLNRDGIKALARIRGIESGVKYAEMFYIQRMKI